ncbi:MAG: Htur_1727 family rSAM-partnered candidate RiPP [Halobacteriales archaeon]
MDEQGSRSRAEAAEQPRSATEQEWEVFLRETVSDPVQHVGSVTAPSSEIAHEQAEQLFDRFARDIWLCPADAVHRYSVTSMTASPAGTSTDTESNAEPTPSSPDR